MERWQKIELWIFGIAGCSLVLMILSMVAFLWKIILFGAPKGVAS